MRKKSIPRPAPTSAASKETAAGKTSAGIKTSTTPANATKAVKKPRRGNTAATKKTSAPASEKVSGERKLATAGLARESKAANEPQSRPLKAVKAIKAAEGAKPAVKSSAKSANKSAGKTAAKPAKPEKAPAAGAARKSAGRKAGKSPAKIPLDPVSSKVAEIARARARVNTASLIADPVETTKAPASKANGKARGGKSAAVKPAAPAEIAAPVVAAVPQAGSKLEKQLAASPVRIFQIYFESWQKELLDPAFAPLNNAGAKSEELEFDVFERLARSEYVKGATLWGALSWRFAEKTGMSGADLTKAIEAAPGADIYYCNPYPVNEALFHNMWTHGETRHPRFLALARALFQALGVPEDELNSIATSLSFSASNYFIASPAFWSKYLPFVRKVLTLADKKLAPEARKLLHSSAADERGLHHGATYVPFIVERLFPLFMRTEGKGLKVHKIALPERERELNVHLKLLREMKDVAHRTKSPWLAACWVNYRNLYLSQTNGKAWCQKYLRAITPTDIKFG